MTDRLAPNVWLLQSAFSMYRVVKIGLNGLVLRVKPADRDVLALINPPTLTPAVVAEIRQIEAETEATVEVIVQPGDWHHFQLPAAQAAFPEAVMYVASERNLRKQPSLTGAKVLDRTATGIPELGDEVVLVPWLGYTQDGMPKLMSGEKKGAARIEFVVFHKPSGTVFLTDHFLPPVAGKPMQPNTIGFHLADADAAKDSVRQVNDLDIQRVVFSHGTRTACVLQTDAAKALTTEYEGLLKAHGQSPCEPCANDEVADTPVEDENHAAEQALVEVQAMEVVTAAEAAPTEASTSEEPVMQADEPTPIVEAPTVEAVEEPVAAAGEQERAAEEQIESQPEGENVQVILEPADKAQSKHIKHINIARRLLFRAKPGVAASA